MRPDLSCFWHCDSTPTCVSIASSTDEYSHRHPPVLLGSDASTSSPTGACGDDKQVNIDPHGHCNQGSLFVECRCQGDHLLCLLQMHDTHTVFSVKELLKLDLGQHLMDVNGGGCGKGKGNTLCTKRKLVQINNLQHTPDCSLQMLECSSNIPYCFCMFSSSLSTMPQPPFPFDGLN